MSSGFVQPRLIDDQWLREHQNKQVDDSMLEHAITYSKRADGASRTLKLIVKGAHFGNETLLKLGRSSSAAFDTVIKTLGKRTSALKIMAIPTLTQNAYRSLSKWYFSENKSEQQRVILSGLEDVMDALTIYGASTLLFYRHPLISSAIHLTSLTSDVIGLNLSGRDYLSAVDGENRTTGEIKAAYTHSRKYYMLKVAQTVIDLAIVILGVGIGTSVITPFVGAFLALVVGVITVAKDLYKHMGRYQVITF